MPELREPQALDHVLTDWAGDRSLLVCDETGVGEPIVEAAARLGPRPAALLTGPEGGFAETELDYLGKLSFVIRIGLGPRVLRADTAALAALAAFSRRSPVIGAMPASTGPVHSPVVQAGRWPKAKFCWSSAEDDDYAEHARRADRRQAPARRIP